MATQQVPRLKGQTVFDSTGERLGDVQRVFYDQATNEAAWITVPGVDAHEAFIPMAGSRLGPPGLTVAVPKDMIVGAPAIAAGPELTAADAAQLDRYYTGMLSLAPEAPPAGGPQPKPQPTTETAQPTELTSFEERVQVGTEAMESGTVRLHKTVVTEPVETTVPVRHEELHIERVPVDSPAPTAGHQFEEECVEVTLHEERPIIVKETVPIETVRVSTATDSDERPVSDQVQRERIEVDDQRARTR